MSTETTTSTEGRGNHGDVVLNLARDDRIEDFHTTDPSSEPVKKVTLSMEELERLGAVAELAAVEPSEEQTVALEEALKGLQEVGTPKGQGLQELRESLTHLQLVVSPVAGQTSLEEELRKMQGLPPSPSAR